jgi:hypothetical protein
VTAATLPTQCRDAGDDAGSRITHAELHTLNKGLINIALAFIIISIKVDAYYS